eukprot:3277-Heterococcus_DN1.PRE.4
MWHLLAVLALVSEAAALLTVQLLPLEDTPATRSDSSAAVGCRFQVVAELEQEWSDELEVCIWPHVTSISAATNFIPDGAQCIHSVVGTAMFAATAPGEYMLSAAIAHRKYSRDSPLVLSRVSTFSVRTFSAASELENAVPAVARSMQAAGFDLPAYGIRGPIRWSALPKQLQDEYTMNGAIPVIERFMFNNNDPRPEDSPIEYPKESAYLWSDGLLVQLIDMASARVEIDTTYPHACRDLYSAFDVHPIEGRTVLVVGSLFPWVEAIAAVYGKAKLPVYTVDFNKPIVENIELQSVFKTLRIPELDDLIQSGQRFDAVISYSSLEHDGLGRYGDELNPNADLERMAKIKQLLTHDGLAYIAVPAGLDKLWFNAHRVYGKIRFPLFTAGYEVLGHFDPADYANMFERDAWDWQPLHVLRPIW